METNQQLCEKTASEISTSVTLSVRMLCRRCDGGCFAALFSLGPADTLPPLLLSGGCFAAVFALLFGRLWRMIRHCGAASSGGYLATLWLFLWSQSAASVMLFSM